MAASRYHIHAFGSATQPDLDLFTDESLNLYDKKWREYPCIDVKRNTPVTREEVTKALAEQE